jgi:hypothetical protein
MDLTFAGHERLEGPGMISRAKLVLEKVLQRRRWS